MKTIKLSTLCRLFLAFALLAFVYCQFNHKPDGSKPDGSKPEVTVKDENAILIIIDMETLLITIGDSSAVVGGIKVIDDYMIGDMMFLEEYLNRDMSDKMNLEDPALNIPQPIK